VVPLPRSGGPARPSVPRARPARSVETARTAATGGRPGLQQRGAVGAPEDERSAAAPDFARRTRTSAACSPVVASALTIEAGAAPRVDPMSSALAPLLRPRRRRDRRGERQPPRRAMSAQECDSTACTTAADRARPPVNAFSVGVGSAERLVDLAHASSRAFGLSVVSQTCASR